MKKKKPKPATKPPTRKPVESLASKHARAARILKSLHVLYPEATCALEHDSPLKLLVATILSAQCTDVRVNMVTPQLFARYKSAAEFARAKPAELEGLIRSTGFFRNKARNIIGAAKTITEQFSGQVPDSMESLLQLPGVARKTANVVLGTWFQKNDGVVVDTHIGRLAHRLDFTWTSKDDKDAVRIEQDLMQVFPRDEWTFAGHALIQHGRAVCSARKPDCAACTLSADCPSAFKLDGKPPARGKADTASRKPRRR